MKKCPLPVELNDLSKGLLDRNSVSLDSLADELVHPEGGPAGGHCSWVSVRWVPSSR